MKCCYEWTAWNSRSDRTKCKLFSSACVFGKLLYTFRWNSISVTFNNTIKRVTDFIWSWTTADGLFARKLAHNFYYNSIRTKWRIAHLGIGFFSGNLSKSFFNFHPNRPITPHSHAYESNYIFGTPSGKADREGRGNWRYGRILREMKLQLGTPHSQNSSYFFKIGRLNANINPYSLCLKTV